MNIMLKRGEKMRRGEERDKERDKERESERKRGVKWKRDM